MAPIQAALEKNVFVVMPRSQGCGTLPALRPP